MRLIWYVAAGGAAGSAMRYVLASWIQSRSGSPFPMGTLIVNISGSILLGLLLRYALETPAISPEMRALLTTGVLATRPMPGSGAISLVNAGVEGFVRAAALELPRGVRILAVSPPWVTETLVALKMDTKGGKPAAEVAQAYVKALEGGASGQILAV